MPLVFEVLVTSLFLYFVCFTATDDAQGLLLAGLVEPRRMLGIEAGSVKCKASALPVILSLWPL